MLEEINKIEGTNTMIKNIFKDGHHELWYDGKNNLYLSYRWVQVERKGAWHLEIIDCNKKNKDA